MAEISEPTIDDQSVLLKLPEAYAEIEEDLTFFDEVYGDELMCELKYQQRLIRLLHHYRQRCEELEKHAPDVASPLSDQSATIARLEAENAELRKANESLRNIQIPGDMRDGDIDSFFKREGAR